MYQVDGISFATEEEVEEVDKKKKEEKYNEKDYLVYGKRLQKKTQMKNNLKHESYKKHKSKLHKK